MTCSFPSAGLQAALTLGLCPRLRGCLSRPGSAGGTAALTPGPHGTPRGPLADALARVPALPCVVMRPRDSRCGWARQAPSSTQCAAVWRRLPSFGQQHLKPSQCHSCLHCWKREPDLPGGAASLVGGRPPHQPTSRLRPPHQPGPLPPPQWQLAWDAHGETCTSRAVLPRICEGSSLCLHALDTCSTPCPLGRPA